MANFDTTFIVLFLSMKNYMFFPSQGTYVRKSLVHFNSSKSKEVNKIHPVPIRLGELTLNGSSSAEVGFRGYM